MLSIVFLKFDKQDSAVSTDSGSYCSHLVHSPDCRVEIVNKKSRAGKFKRLNTSALVKARELKLSRVRYFRSWKLLTNVSKM